MEQKDFEHIHEYMQSQGFDYGDYLPFIMFLDEEMSSEEFTLKVIGASTTNAYNSYNSKEDKIQFKKQMIEFIEGL